MLYGLAELLSNSGIAMNSTFINIKKNPKPKPCKMVKSLKNQPSGSTRVTCAHCAAQQPPPPSFLKLLFDAAHPEQDVLTSLLIIHC